MESVSKIVRFDIFCRYCKDWKTKETDDPCNECLAETVNESSTCPICFKPKNTNVKPIDILKKELGE